MKRYAVADYLSAEQKAAMLAHRYEYSASYGLWVDEDGYCPIGHAVGDALDQPIPDDPRLVARELMGDRYWQAEQAAVEEVEQAVEQFCHDWDTGRIPPDALAAALGVEP